MNCRKMLVFLAMLSPVSVPAASYSGLAADYNRLMQDPRDLDRLYDYAREAIDAGNFEAAIGALEGMLVVARNQPRVLLELGVLYQRLGAPRTAEVYLRRAKQASPPGSAVAEEADRYLREAKLATAHQQLTGIVRLGLRYQSNATLSPETDEILSNGLRVPLPPSRRREGDYSALVFSHVGHRYQLTRRTAIASDLVVYGTGYARQDQLNFGLLELATGPLYESPRTASGQYAVRPHLLLRGSVLDGKRFERSAGVGLDLRYAPGASSVFKATYRYWNQSFSDFNGYGNAPLRGGADHSLDLRWRQEVRRGQLLEVGLFGRHKQAESDYFALDQYEIRLRYGVKLDNRLFPGLPPVTLTPFAVRSVYDYGGPDPGVDPGSNRHDREWRVGVDCDVPVARGWTLLLSLQHSRRRSNIVNYDAENNTLTAGIQKGF